MSPRANEPPRRGTEPRRGASPSAGGPPPARKSTRAGEAAPSDEAGETSGRAFDGIGAARAYTPRGRTVRESGRAAREESADRDAGDRGRAPRTGRGGDPFRPVLQVLDGGQSATRDRRRPGDDPPARRSRTDGEPSASARRSRTEDEPPASARRSRTEEGPARRSRTGDEPAVPIRRTRTERSTTSEKATRAQRTTRSPRPERDTVRRGPSSPPAPRRDGTTGRPSGTTGRPLDTAGRSRGSIGRPPGGGGRPPGAARRPLPTPPPPLADARRRLRIGTVVALTMFAAIGVRLVGLQVSDSPALAQSIREQREERLTSVVLPAPRGSILDRSGAVLAHSIEARYVYADPVLVKNPQRVAAALSPELGIAPSRLLQLMAPRTRPGGGASRFEYLARGVDVSIAEKISALNLPGIGQHRDERREVPGRDQAANLIGFTGEDLDGLEGLEARYDELLKGVDGKRVFMTGNPAADKGQLAKEIPGGYHYEDKPKPGTSIELTVDGDLQYGVTHLLGAELAKVRAVIGAAVVMDVRTGEVLVQASYPAYDAAKPQDARPIDRDDVASSVIADPGSSHKAFIFGAALQEGIIKADSTMVVGPQLRRGGAPFKDSHPHPKGTAVTMPGLLAYSSNVGTILLADKLTPQKVYEYQQRFGLGRATGEGMPGEASGRLLAPDEWSASGSGSIPIGHSVDATLIQMAAGYAAIANNGTYIQPHLIRATIAADGTRTPAPAPETHPVLSPTNAAALRTMMEAVVDVPGATGNLARVPGYRVAGKTGTGKRLINGKYTSYEAGSFIGMAPADNPRYVIAVFADTPGGGGGVVAGPAFSKMMALTLAHYHVPPSGAPAPKFTICPTSACW